MKMEAEKDMEEFREKPNKIFKFVKLMKRNGKDVEGGKWIKGVEMEEMVSVKKIDVKYGRNIIMEKIMNEENAWNHLANMVMVEGPAEVSHKEVKRSDQEDETEKGCGLSEITTEMMVAGGL